MFMTDFFFGHLTKNSDYDWKKSLLRNVITVIVSHYNSNLREEELEMQSSLVSNLYTACKNKQ